MTSQPRSIEPIKEGFLGTWYTGISRLADWPDPRIYQVIVIKGEVQTNTSSRETRRKSVSSGFKMVITTIYQSIRFIIVLPGNSIGPGVIVGKSCIPGESLIIITVIAIAVKIQSTISIYVLTVLSCYLRQHGRQKYSTAWRSLIMTMLKAKRCDRIGGTRLVLDTCTQIGQRVYPVQEEFFLSYPYVQQYNYKVFP